MECLGPYTGFYSRNLITSVLRTIHDAIHRIGYDLLIQESISGIRAGTHAKRVEVLVPSMFRFPFLGKCGFNREVGYFRLRNDLFHEAKFGGAPIISCFPQMKGNILLQLKAFNCRLMASLGATGNYFLIEQSNQGYIRF